MWNFDFECTGSVKNLIFLTIARTVSHDCIELGVQASPRSIKVASSCATHMPTLSPYLAIQTGFLNICMDFTFFSTFKLGISTVSPTFTYPPRTVPVITVPWPLIWKQWSIAKRKFYFLFSRFGMSMFTNNVLIKSSIPNENYVEDISDFVI